MQTSAVEEAVAARLVALGADPEASAHRARLEAARAVVSAFRADLTSEDVARIQHADEDLYDETGRPR